MLHTSGVKASVHDAVFDLHVSGQISFQSELAGAVEALEWLAVRVQVHVAHQVVHSVEFFAAKLEKEQNHSGYRNRL